MNHPPINRSAAISLWTLGHRSHYSPMLRVAGGFSAFPAVGPGPVRPNRERGRAVAPAGAGAAEDLAGGEARFPVSR
ncbi:MAG TPA: hypothetical protein VLT83_12690 [Opitutaceae bacterium]|nr:hypothetical protein [Opitutaceae bacterium]